MSLLRDTWRSQNRNETNPVLELRTRRTLDRFHAARQTTASLSSALSKHLFDVGTDAEGETRNGEARR